MDTNRDCYRLNLGYNRMDKSIHILQLTPISGHTILACVANNCLSQAIGLLLSPLIWVNWTLRPSPRMPEVHLRLGLNIGCGLYVWWGQLMLLSPIRWCAWHPCAWCSSTEILSGVWWWMRLSCVDAPSYRFSVLDLLGLFGNFSERFRENRKLSEKFTRISQIYKTHIKLIKFRKDL